MNSIIARIVNAERNVDLQSRFMLHLGLIVIGLLIMVMILVEHGLSLALLRQEELTVTLARMRLTLLLLGGGAMLVLFISVHFLWRRITQPLEQLATATTIISSGNLEHSVDVNLPGELGGLASRFNVMTHDLKRSRDAIMYLNQHLENMVHTRTSALQQKAHELEMVNAELKQVDRLKSDFLGNVSHELRTPLTSIRSTVEMMLEQGEDLEETERHEFLELIAGQSARLTRLISDLLDLSRIEAGGFDCRPAAAPLHEIAGSCIGTLRYVASEQGVHLRNEIGDDLPPIFGDMDRMSQVLTNLIDNAIKFTPAGGSIRVLAKQSAERRRVTGLLGDSYDASHGLSGIEALESEHEEYVIISVHDNGVGIRPEDQQRVFDKFCQLGNIMTDKPQGTGLGLAIAGSIVARHGGALWVESVPDKGSVFSFSIPLAASHTVLESTSQPVPE